MQLPVLRLVPTKRTARLTKLCKPLRRLSRLLTKPTSAHCACWSALAASEPLYRPDQLTGCSGRLQVQKSRPDTGRLFNGQDFISTLENRLFVASHCLAQLGNLDGQAIFPGNDLAHHFPIQS